MRKALILLLVWRSLLFIPLLMAALIPFRQGFEYTSIGKYITSAAPWYHYLFFPWANFDGIHYLSIARYGYELNGRFFPLFSSLIAFFSLSLFFGNWPYFYIPQLAVALLLTFAIFAGAIIALYRLLRIDYSEKIIFWSIVNLLCFPASFFYAAVYSEGLFLLLSVISFYFLRKQKWGIASVFGALLTLTRPVGILILPVFLFEYIRVKKRLSLPPLQFFLIPIAFLAYSLFNFFRWNDALYFLHSQGNVGNQRTVTSIIFPFQTVFRYGKILATLPPSQYEWWIAILEVGTFFVVSLLVYIAWRKKIHPSYIMFSLFCFLVPVFSGTFTGLPRYSIGLFPVFVALALVNNKLIRYGYLIIGLLLQFLLLMLFSRGYFVA